MLVKDIMTPSVECARPNTTVQEAARMMSKLDVGSLPVCGYTERLEGIITDRDIVRDVVAKNADPAKTHVGDVMTPEVAYCFDDQDVVEAARLMESKQIRRLVVLNRDKRLVGIVSLGDLALKSDDERLVSNAIRAVSEPAHS
jgi:CBS domain-containing protein